MKELLWVGFYYVLCEMLPMSWTFLVLGVSNMMDTHLCVVF